MWSPEYPLDPWTMTSRVVERGGLFHVFNKFNQLVARTTTFEAARAAKALIDS